jgi:hypothetical protein
MASFFHTPREEDHVTGTRNADDCKPVTTLVCNAMQKLSECQTL